MEDYEAVYIENVARKTKEEILGACVLDTGCEEGHDGWFWAGNHRKR